MSTSPNDHSHLPVEVRLELVVGALADLLAPARSLTTQLKLRANASAATRSDLDHLIELAGSIWERQDAIRSDINQLRGEIRS